MADLPREKSEAPLARQTPATTPPAAPPRSPSTAVTKPKPRRRRRILRPLLLLLGPLLVTLVAGYVYLTGGRYVSTDNAYVQAGILNVSTDVAGIVSDVLVTDNEEVQTGQVLFRLDEQPFRIALDQAKAERGMVVNDLEAMKASYRQKEAEIAAAEADLAFARHEFERQSSLAERNVAARASLDRARTGLSSAEGDLQALRHELEGLAASLGGSPDMPIESHPRYLAAAAAVDEAQRKLDHAVVRAPIDGIVANVDSLQPGASLAAGQAGFSLVADHELWIEAKPKETDLTHVQAGQPVTITVDTYPGVEWHGTVSSISPASSAQFSVLPAQNASGNWVKVVQRIPLRIAVNADSALPPLRAGMSAEVEIDTGRQRSLAQLFDFGGDGKAYAQSPNR